MKLMSKIYRDLAGIGIELSGVKPNRRADIERTLLIASEHADGAERRLFGLIASWIVVHGGLVSIGKMRRLMRLEKIGDPQIISALAFVALDNGHHEWGSLAKSYPARVLWDSVATRSAIGLKGEEPTLLKAGLRVPNTFLRLRTSDIATVANLSKLNLQVRLRLIFGVNPRADAIFYLSFEALSAKALMRKIGCSYEPANRIMRELREAGSLAIPSINL